MVDHTDHTTGPARRHELDHTYKTTHRSASKYLDHDVGTDHTDHLPELCIVPPFQWPVYNGQKVLLYERTNILHRTTLFRNIMTVLIQY